MKQKLKLINLNLKIDITKEQILTQLESRIEILNDKVNLIKSKVDNQENDIKQLNTNMTEAIKDYRAEISNMTDKLNQKMQENQAATARHPRRPARILINKVIHRWVLQPKIPIR